MIKEYCENKLLTKPKKGYTIDLTAIVEEEILNANLTNSERVGCDPIDYQPSVTDSILSAVDLCADRIQEITETVEEFNRSNTERRCTIRTVRVRFIRPDCSIINEIEISPRSYEDANEILKSLFLA